MSSFFILLNGTASVYVDSRSSGPLQLLPSPAKRGSARRPLSIRNEREQPASSSHTSATSSDRPKVSTGSATKPHVLNNSSDGTAAPTDALEDQTGDAKIGSEGGAEASNSLSRRPSEAKNGDARVGGGEIPSLGTIEAKESALGRSESTASHNSEKCSGAEGEFRERRERGHRGATGSRANAGREQQGSPQRSSVSDMAAIEARVRSIGATRCAPEERHRLGKLVTQYGMHLSLLHVTGRGSHSPFTSCSLNALCVPFR